MFSSCFLHLSTSPPCLHNVPKASSWATFFWFHGWSWRSFCPYGQHATWLLRFRHKLKGNVFQICLANGSSKTLHASGSSEAQWFRCFNFFSDRLVAFTFAHSGRWRTWKLCWTHLDIEDTKIWKQISMIVKEYQYMGCSRTSGLKARLKINTTPDATSRAAGTAISGRQGIGKGKRVWQILANGQTTSYYILLLEISVTLLTTIIIYHHLSSFIIIYQFCRSIELLVFLSRAPRRLQWHSVAGARQPHRRGPRPRPTAPPESEAPGAAHGGSPGEESPGSCWKLLKSIGCLW